MYDPPFRNSPCAKAFDDGKRVGYTPAILITFPPSRLLPMARAHLEPAVFLPDGGQRECLQIGTLLLFLGQAYERCFFLTPHNPYTKKK